MEYIKEMGLYNVSDEDLDYNKAKNSARGTAMLQDAGENLINNTFVTVTELIFFSNEPLAEVYNAMAQSFLQQKSNTGNAMADAIVNLTYATTAAVFLGLAAKYKDGYSVLFKTFLFKLKWNEDIAGKFYNIWGDENAFERMSFELEYIGYHYNTEQVNPKIFTKSKNRETEIVLNIALARTLDASFVTLQHRNDVFKPIVPVFSTTPYLTAKIGMKEGLEGNEKFAILQKIEDPVTFKTKWQKVGTTTVDKKQIWDNRYNAGDEPNNVVMGKDGLPIKATTFQSSNSAQEGMFLKQITQKKSKKKKK
jgi:hypothetical protein